MRILFDKNVPVGVRDFLDKHEVRTLTEMKWPARLENGELVKAAETEGFDVTGTSPWLCSGRISGFIRLIAESWASDRS